MKPNECRICGAAPDKFWGPRHGLTTWEFSCNDNGKWYVSTWAGGSECLWFWCGECRAAFHTATWRDQFNKLSEPDAKRAMELFLAGNPPKRLPWLGLGALLGYAISWLPGLL